MKSVINIFLGILIGSVISLNAFAKTTNKEYPSILEGHAVLSAASYIATPGDAPNDLQTSGKFINNLRVDKLDFEEGKSNGRLTGIKFPFKGQPLQGHSGIKYMPADDTYWVITDNGAGSKANSPDFMLYLNQYKIDFNKNEIKHLKTIFLNDPNKKVPFRIANEATKTRYLTGSDFDPESFQFADGYLWIGDEFGPYLIQAEPNGKIVEVFDTYLNGKLIRSPDNYAVTTPSKPGQTIDFEANRSKGFEGMALSADGQKLYALLEGSLFNKKNNNYENISGKQYLRILEFDIKNKKWSGRHWKYVLENNTNSIGDFNMIDADHGLIIERDNGEGIVEYACQTEDSSRCFPNQNLPKLKRVYKIRISENNVNNVVDKLGYVDLLSISDKYKKSHVPLSQGKFVFPFFTIENVDVVDKTHIVIGNDNNLPFSSSRLPNKADDNEFILLNVGDFLK